VERRWVSVSLPKFCEKLLPYTKFLLKSAIGCWVMGKIRFAIWRVWAILKKFILVTWLSWVPNMLLCIKFYQNRDDFCWYMAIDRFAIWQPFALLNFWNLEFMSRDLYRHAILLHDARFRSYNSIHSLDITISSLEKTNVRHIEILLPVTILTISLY